MNVLIALLLFIIVSTVRASLTAIEADSLDINDAVIDIIKSCSSKEVRTVGVMASTDYFLSRITSSGLYDVTVIGTGSKFHAQSQTSGEMSYKLHTFVINAFSSTDLSYSLQILKSSIWWNFLGRFIIVEKYSADNYCKNAGDFLSILWKYNIGNGIFICTGSTAKVMLFGFNPYNEQRPSLWSLDRVDIHNDFNKHPFTIFKRHFTTECTCHDIFFEQSSDLNGYVITLNLKKYPPTAETNIDRSSQLVIQNHNYLKTKDYYYVKIKPRDWSNFKGVDSILAKEFFNFYNATAIIKIYDNNGLFGAVREDGEFYGMLKDLESGDIDLSFNNRFMLLKGDLPLTYPWKQSELTLVTHPRGDMNIIMRIIAFLNFEISISIIVICLLTIFFFGFLVDKGVQLAVLDTLQLLLGMSLPHMPFSVPPRIFLSCLMLYYFIISASVQSNMYAIVTVPQALQNIDSLADLELFTRKLYTNSIGANILGREFHKYLEVIENDHCIDRILNESQMGCIDDLYYLKYAAAQHKLHIMKEGISKSYLVNPMRKDWPMSDTLKSFTKKFNEAGILSMFWLDSVRAADDAIYRHKEKYQKKKFHVMTFSKCSSIFLLSIVGSFISTIAFFMELKIFRYKQKHQNNTNIMCRRIRVSSMIKLDESRGCR